MISYLVEEDRYVLLELGVEHLHEFSDVRVSCRGRSKAENVFPFTEIHRRDDLRLEIGRKDTASNFWSSAVL